MSTARKIFVIALLFLLGTAIGESILRAQCPMVCRQDFTISLGGDGEAVLTPEVALSSATGGCTEGFTVEIIDNLSGYSYGDTADATMIGADLMFKVTDNATGNNCEGGITVADNTPPVIFLDSLFLNCNADTDPEIIGFPGVQDNVSHPDNITYDWIDTFTDHDCFYGIGGEEYTAEILRTWYVTDEYGNIRSADQIIMLHRNTLDDVQWPANRDGFVMPSLVCNQDDPADLTLTGQPRINGKIIEGSSDCDLLTSFSDQTTVVCGGETKIFRTWAVFDYCTDDSETYIQLIRVKDTQAPTITCPADFTVFTDNGNCTGTVTPPAATATDNCSNFTLTHLWEYGENAATYSNIPQGTHAITYEAQDECGNKSTCQTAVTIIDNEVPTPVCKEHTFISLGEEENTVLAAHTFNENSTDNCQIDRFEVSKNGAAFAPSASFDCSDILASPLAITLRVYDVAGLHNDCAVEVSVDDFLAPSIVCPLPVELNCTDDYNNLTISGTATATDNCAVASIIPTDDISDLNDCGYGTVLRLWTATDEDDNSAFCVQQITVGDATPTDVVFPADFTTYECSLKLDPDHTGYPEISGADCEQILSFHTDDTIAVTDACLHIVRFWEVYDECVFDPNDSAEDGYWSFNQTLKIYDNEMPELSVPADITVFIYGEDCETYVEFPDAWATDCSAAVEVSNNSFYADDNKENASGTYPAGFHYITFTARDECDNITNLSMDLYVLDAQIPTVLCNEGFTVNLGSNGTVAVNPQLFDAGSYDNCSETLTYHLTPHTFGCADRGDNEVLFQVRDAEGNEASCWTNLTVQDNGNICPDGTIAGKITNAEGENIDGKYVGLSGGVQMAVATETDGTYAFPDLPAGEFYAIKPTYNLNPLNGVTTNDIIGIRKHILGLEEIESPYTFIAADVNNSGDVTTLDMVWMRKLILGSIEEFPNNKSWRFVDKNFVFDANVNATQQNFPEEIIIPVLNQNHWDTDFIAVKIGDINGTANLTDGGAEERDFSDKTHANLLPIHIKNVTLKKGENYFINFSINEVTGAQFGTALDYTKVLLHDIKCANENVTAAHFGREKTAAGKVNFSWNTESEKAETLDFTLHFTALADGELSDVLHFNETRITAEAYRDNEIYKLAFDFDKAVKSVRLLQNFPNPAKAGTTVVFDIPTAENVTLFLSDIEGNMLQELNADYPQGRQEIYLENLPKGVLFYWLEIEGKKTEVQRMLVL